MKPHHKDRSLEWEESVARVFDIYFPFDRDYGDDFDIEYPPSLADSDVSPSTDHGNTSTDSN